MDAATMYVNLRTGVGHLHRDCEAIVLLPDLALRIWHGKSSSLPDLRLCRRCFPLPGFDYPDPRGPADVTAALHTDSGVSRVAARPDPEGVDTPESLCGGSVTSAGPPRMTAEARDYIRSMIDHKTRLEVVEYDELGRRKGGATHPSGVRVKRAPLS